MTPDERDRLARLEAEHRTLKEWTESIDKKVDRLLEAASMGKGAWWAMLRVGGLMVLVATAGAWIFDHFPRK